MRVRKRKSAIGTAVSFLALSAIVASPSQADTIRIEIDYMGANNGSTHSHQPSSAVVNAVIQMFSCQGHTLTIDVDDELTHYNVLKRSPTNCGDPDICPTFFGYSGVANSFGSIKAANKDNGSTWHYCIFAHNYENCDCNTSGSSGLAEISGDDFVVTLGSFSGQTGTVFDQAATLAHEFGHNLGLGHCGTEYCGSDTSDPNYAGPYMPNMPSIMSYRYQLWGVKNRMLCFGYTFDETIFKQIDYSHGRMCNLNENSLDEGFGNGMLQIDWDCDGSIDVSNVAEDINGNSGGWCSVEVNRTVLNDYDEWANASDPILFRSRSELDHAEEISCITFEEWQEVQWEMDARGGCTQPTLVTESCINVEGRNVYVGFTAGATGKCTSSYSSVQTAQTNAPSGATYFLDAGTYNETGATVLNKRGKYFCKIGSAVVK